MRRATAPIDRIFPFEGFCFAVDPVTKRDVFVHQSTVRPWPPALGTLIRFTVTETMRGLRAIDVEEVPS